MGLVFALSLASLQGGPVISGVTNNPSLPTALEPAWITAHVADAASVTLFYGASPTSSQTTIRSGANVDPVPTAVNPVIRPDVGV